MLFMHQVSRNLEDTARIAGEFLASIEKGERATVVALQGDLGAGKTAFAQEVGKLLGVSDNMASPTFVIEKIYDIDWNGFEKLIHIDAYRLESEKELLHLGWEEVVREPENLVVIEWPERVSSLIPSDAKRVQFKFIDNTTREIFYES